MRRERLSGLVGLEEGRESQASKLVGPDQHGRPLARVASDRSSHDRRRARRALAGRNDQLSYARTADLYRCVGSIFATSDRAPCVKRGRPRTAICAGVDVAGTRCEEAPLAASLYGSALTSHLATPWER